MKTNVELYWDTHNAVVVGRMSRPQSAVQTSYMPEKYNVDIQQDSGYIHELAMDIAVRAHGTLAQCESKDAMTASAKI